MPRYANTAARPARRLRAATRQYIRRGACRGFENQYSTMSRAPRSRSKTFRRRFRMSQHRNGRDIVEMARRFYICDGCFEPEARCRHNTPTHAARRRARSRSARTRQRHVLWPRALPRCEINFAPSSLACRAAERDGMMVHRLFHGQQRASGC